MGQSSLFKLTETAYLLQLIPIRVHQFVHRQPPKDYIQTIAFLWSVDGCRREKGSKWRGVGFQVDEEWGRHVFCYLLEVRVWDMALFDQGK